MRAELLLLKLRVGHKGLAGVGTGSLHTHRATFSSWLQASLGQFHNDSDGNPALELDYWPSKGVQLAKTFQLDQLPSAQFFGTGCLSSPLQSFFLPLPRPHGSNSPETIYLKSEQH